MLSCCIATSAFSAGSVTQPGETVGLCVRRSTSSGSLFRRYLGLGAIEAGSTLSLKVYIPVLAWSTPSTVPGGRVQFLIAGPVVEVGVHRTTYLRGVILTIHLVSGQLPGMGPRKKSGDFHAAGCLSGR